MLAVLLYIAGAAISVEVAATQEARDKGLSGRDHLPDNAGMLFVFPRPRDLSFWMVDTSIPLDIAFFDAERRLVRIAEMEPYSSVCETSGTPCQYALEVVRGTFEKLHIGPGEKFSLSAE